MHVKELHLRDFTAFSAVDLSFSKGLNIFIGENGTGKSHAMKVIYALLRAAAEQPKGSAQEIAEALGERLARVFCPAEDRLAHLVRQQVRQGAAGDEDVPRTSMISMSTDVGANDFSIAADESLSPTDAIAVTSYHWSASPKSLFIPAPEVLSLFEGFVPAYETYQLSFDETFYDLCKALNQSPLRDQGQPFIKTQREKLEGLLGGTVKRRGSRFYVDFGTGEIEAHLVAEGYRKIASLVQLVSSGAIAPGSVLLWDEPESNLNPRLIVQVAEVLVDLARAGVQVFVSTHDYLLSCELAALGGDDMRVFSFYQDEERGHIEVEHGNSLDEVANNPIVAEYARQYERDLERFAKDADEE